ncbi:tRNA (adenosine(37)-N6)-dimethylallyltransferase MiaA [Thiovibrio sp. JS02]
MASGLHHNPIAEPVLVLLGPTAVGKTALSLRLAQRFSCEIVGLDSMQIHRRMDIGTAKASPEERALIPHHLIDIVDPDEEYHVGRYVEDAVAACREIIGRGKRPMLVGGTGLYLKALMNGLFEVEANEPTIRTRLKERLAEEGRAVLFSELVACDPQTAARIHSNDTQRLLRALEIFLATGRGWSTHLAQQPRQEPVFSRVLKIGLQGERETLYERIDFRVQQMVEHGLLDEVRSLLDMGYPAELKSMQAIGYRHMVNFLSGAWQWEEALRLLARDTRRYAKRQLTWFGADPEIRWFSPEDEQGVLAKVAVFLNA